ncbi:sensor histidine kinase [Nonomuraea spiralis]|uniref:sensor histidine kinase n=1 Tax=Nonomuraea TaxID=83681 RepID=UPI000F79A902|nr:ATP-binding protein [Nonomuraea sp. WAC 01424]RSN05788.1 two-component sensor histidine kinase [Nonomuraea sp. WAC 01424]
MGGKDPGETGEGVGSLRPLPLSVQARLTLATAVLSLIVCTAIGIALDLLIRDRLRQNVFADTQRATTEWIGSMTATPSPPVTTSEVDLLQLVDARGHVVVASRAASGRPPISTLRPASDDRIQHGVACADGECVMFTATRPSPQEERLLWGGAAHVVYAGLVEPPLLGTRRLELLLASGVLAVSALLTWIAAFLIGRTLRPVEAMRARMAEITVTDLSKRVPEPPGDDAVAQLARTANKTLGRLEEAVEQQRNFSSMVSHELRTPLTGLRVRLEEALTYPDADPHAALRDALSTADRFQAIIEEMLSLARVRTAAPGHREPVRLGTLVREEVASRRAGPLIRVDAEEDVEVLGNRVQVGEVLTNLLVNAQRHARTLVEVRVERRDGQAVVSVRDDGAGVAPADRERVFEPFVRLTEGRRRDPEGSGLGLAISRAIARAHQGDLGIEDSPQGPRFVLRLPLPPGPPT